MQYFESHNQLRCDQSAFRKKHSTTTALHRLVDDLLDNMNEGMVNAICFFDLKKCFDSIDHKLLILKLEKYGILDREMLWFTDYLYDRTQSVFVNGSSSSFNDINVGVPQGSVLGPLLFLVFINDLPCCLTNTFLNIYADDTVIHACGSDINNVQQLLQRDVDIVSQWFFHNKLLVNELKTHCMIVTSNRKLLSHRLNINLNGTQIEQVKVTKYLGFCLDTKLCWSDHINKLVKKIAPKIGLLRRLRYIVSFDCLSKYYMATVQSHMDYCLTVWGFTSSHNLHLIQKMQNRAARLITNNFDFNTRGIDIVRDLGWLNITQRRDYFTALLVFKSSSGNLPDHILDNFTFKRDIAIRQTRSCDTNVLYVPKINRSSFKSALQVNGPMIWNNLPIHIRNCNSIHSFKRLLKTFLLQQS